MTRDEVLKAWLAAKAAAEAAVKHEQELRQQIVSTLFGPLVVGTNKLDVGNGYSFKADVGYNYALANKQGETEAALQHIATASPDGAEIVASLVSWSPRLRLASYNALAPEPRRYIDAVLTVTPAMPKLTFIEPSK